jgi:chromosome partitioning protein
MTVVSFVHQKGGTGKSTLCIAAALALAQTGRRVLLLDTDYQGTSGEWGNRFGHRLGVETRSQVQPIVHKEIGRFRDAFEWILIDGPPSLSPMTESILRASERVVVPLRPALPDVWALPWLAAIIRKLQQEGQPLTVRVVFNQYAGEDLAPLREELAPWRLPLHPDPLPADPAFAAVFAGKPLPGPLAERVLALLAPEPGTPPGPAPA